MIRAWTPPFLHKQGGLVLSMGQFTQWVGAQVQSTGTVQLWPGTPVSQALIEDKKAVGVALCDQGVDKQGKPGDGFMPGMDIHAALTVVGDGPVGPIGQQLDAELGMPQGNHARDWAVGMKFVVDLPEDTPRTGHRAAHVRLSRTGDLWLPVRAPGPRRFAGHLRAIVVRQSGADRYQYLQHWMLHPYRWRFLKGGKLRSWAPKTLGESGRRGEPHLARDGFARIGEGSGTTNVLTGSGVDEAWASGTQLAESVLELLKANSPFTRQNLEATYVKRRRASWLEAEARVAENWRDGFQKGVVRGMLGMALAGLTNGRFALKGEPAPTLRTHPLPLKITIAAEFPPRDCATSQGMRHQGRLAPRSVDAARRLAGHSLRRQTAGDSPGRPAVGGQGASAARLRGPRGFSVPGTLREMRHEDLHRALLRPGHRYRPGRRAGFRPRKMRPLRRVSVELLPRPEIRRIQNE